jgi:hypothetical protein
MMKVGIVRIGAVGAATAMAIVLRARVRELILKKRSPKRTIAPQRGIGLSTEPKAHGRSRSRPLMTQRTSVCTAPVVL